MEHGFPGYIAREAAKDFYGVPSAIGRFMREVWLGCYPSTVGLPRDIAWKGYTVRTGVWKHPVYGRCRVGRLNLGMEVSIEPSSFIRLNPNQ